MGAEGSAMEREITVLVAVTVKAAGPGVAQDAEVARTLVRQLGIRDDTWGIFYVCTDASHPVEHSEHDVLDTEPWEIVGVKPA